MLQCGTLGVRREQHTAIIMHTIMQNKAQEYLTEEINLIRDGTAYNLRDSNYNLARPKSRTEYLKIVFHIVGLNYGMWNSLPNKIKSDQSLESFRKCLRTLGLQNSF